MLIPVYAVVLIIRSQRLTNGIERTGVNLAEIFTRVIH